MIKLLCLLLLSLPLISYSQSSADFKDSFALKMPWQEQVRKGMAKHHAAYKASAFYKNNVIEKPLSVSADTLVYNVKMQTGLTLWGGTATFYQRNKLLFCDLSNVTLLKKAGEEIDFVNVKLHDIEDTPGNRMNLKGIRQKIKEFFDRFK